MRARYVNELTEGSRVDAVFVMRAKEMRAARSGDAYLALTLGDRSGSVPGVLFRPSRVAAETPAGAVVRVRGTITRYRGVRRVSVEDLAPAPSWNPEDLLAPAPRPLEESRREFAALVRMVARADLRRVLDVVFGDDTLMRSFSTLPASQSYHHACVGGLLEHSVTVAGLCARLAARYEAVDRDLLVTAALLHDVGKVDELTLDAAAAYTDEGRLLGHVTLGVVRVRQAAERARLERGSALVLEHAILSHHGELEWGSPKRPSTIEALILHHVDNLDAKTSGFLSLVEGAVRVDEVWTDAHNLFRRPLFAPRSADDDRPRTAPLDDEVACAGAPC